MDYLKYMTLQIKKYTVISIKMTLWFIKEDTIHLIRKQENGCIIGQTEV